MPGLIRGETSDCENPKLDLFTTVDGVAVDMTSVEYQIFEKINDPSAPTQVHPASGRQAVNLAACPSGDRVSTGRYVAHIEIPQGWMIGTHEIRWFFRLNPASPEQTFVEEFEVLATPSASSAETYITVADVRAEGLDDPPTDGDVQAAILLWQELVDRATRQWFRPIELELNVDGNDSDTLFFGVPIISIEEIRINGASEALDPAYYRVYNGNRYPKDQQNPRIKLIDQWDSHRDIYTAPDRYSRRRFRRGAQNQYIKGVFGYVDNNGQPPALIKRALTKLVIEKLTRPIVENPALQPPPIVRGIVTEEWTDGHRVRTSRAGGDLKVRAPGLAGITDDPEILRILQLYRAPIGVATPAGPSYD